MQVRSPRTRRMKEIAVARQEQFEVENRQWKWPRFSLRTVLIVMTLYAVVGGIAAAVAEKDDLFGTLIGGIVLIWCIFCWELVRINRSFFMIYHASQRADMEDSIEEED
jgi:hypothetical protein